MAHATTDAEVLRNALESAGWRYTRQRRAVYEFLGRCPEHHHPTAEEVFRGVQSEVPRISLATIYKSLEALESCGLIARLPAAGDGPDRFDARGDRHYHLRCLRTGAIQDLPTPFDPELIAKLDPGLVDALREQGFHLTGYRLELVGYYEPGDTGGLPRR